MIEAKEFVDGAMGLFADRFSLCSLVFDGVEIGRIKRQVFQGVANLAERVLNIGSFVEGGVIEDNHGGGR